MLSLAIALVALSTACVYALPDVQGRPRPERSAPPDRRRGFYYSILFMMSMPFAILGTFGSMAYLSIRRAKQQADEGAGSFDD